MAKGEKADKLTVGKPTGVPTGPGPDAVGGYETFDGEEAQRYNRAGGHLVSVTARYPGKNPGEPSFRPGKRYRFLETKAELDQLMVRSEEG
jgi:hypothetical protein